MWNTPIAPDAQLNPRSSSWVQRIAAQGPLTSDPTQYTPAIYRITENGQKITVKFSGFFSDYRSGVRVGHGTAPTITGVPMPVGASAGSGTDGQVVLWDQKNGIEWGFWQLKKADDGTYTATNGYATQASGLGDGRFADGLAGRGAGTPYLAGTVTTEDMAAGRIDHALTFAYRYPSKKFVYPASKSDGRGDLELDIPEGARLQLDPTLTEADFVRMGLSPEAIVIAKALQSHGMFVIDNSGSSKIYIEDTLTAGWDPDTINRTMISALPWDKFRVVDTPVAPRS